jgi:DNA-binding beta-propeller fold protein YncE
VCLPPRPPAGVTSLARNKASGELSLVQQFRVDQRQGIVDVPGMVGANSVGVSPNGRFVYVTSGGYYRDHNLLVFSRDRSSGGVLSLVQNIDVYNTTESRVLPTTLLVSNDGAYVYVLGNNYAISTAAILAYRSVSQPASAAPLRSQPAPISIHGAAHTHALLTPASLTVTLTHLPTHPLACVVSAPPLP